jgi:DNA repair protein RecO (recombination protein O)
VIVYTYKTIPYQEHAKLVYGYGEKGLISFLARGVMKLNSPLSFAAEPFRLLDVTLSQGTLPTLKEATLLNRYEHAKKDLIKTMVHHVIGEILAKNMAPEDDHVKLLGLLIKVFNHIEDDEDALSFLAVFMLKTLYFLGFGLHLSMCSECEKNQALGFDLYRLKTLCDVHGASSYDQQMRTLLITYLKADIEKEPLPKLIDASRVLDALGRLYEEHLEFQSKALKELLRLLKKETL